MKTTILFDLDGTLIDSTEAILDGFNYAFRKFGNKVPQKDNILELIGHPLDFMFLHLGIKEDTECYVEAYKERYREISKAKTRLLPGAKEAVELAYKFAKLGVVTTKTGLYSKELLEHLGIMKYFQTLIGREDVINPKPHPEPILKAMHNLQALKDHTWMIGDTCLDMDAAKSAGIGAIGVGCGYGKFDELLRCSEFVKADALESVKFIQKWES